MADTYKSAFEQDEELRRQRDAETALKRSIAESQSRPEQGLSSGAARAQLESIAAQDRRNSHENQREEQMRHVDITGVRRITINPPHAAKVVSSELIMDIRMPSPPEPQQAASAAIPDYPFKGSVVDATHVGVYYGELSNPGGGTFTVSGAVAGASSSVAVSAGDDGIYLQITTDASTYFVTGVDYISNNGAPTDNATTYHIHLFAIDTGGDVFIVQQLVFTNLNYLNAAGSHVPWT